MAEAKGISIWLSLKRDDSIHKHLVNIIGSQSFDPHITLLYLPNANEDDISNIIGGVKDIAKEHKPFSFKFNGLKRGNTFYKSIYLDIENTDQLQSLRSNCESKFHKFTSEKSEFLPHISLFYGPHTDADFTLINRAVTDLGLDHGSGFSIDVYLTYGAADKWTNISSIPLGSSNL